MFNLFFIFFLLSATVQAQSVDHALNVLNITSCGNLCLFDSKLGSLITAAGQCFLKAYPGANSQTPITLQSVSTLFACTCPVYQYYASNSTCLSCINQYTPQFPNVVNDCNTENYNAIAKIYDSSLSSNSVKLGVVSAITIGLLSMSLFIGLF